MNIKEMAEEYRKNAKLISKRINELRDRKSKHVQISHDEMYQINRRITELEVIAAELLRTAYKLETYYDKSSSQETVKYDGIISNYNTEEL